MIPMTCSYTGQNYFQNIPVYGKCCFNAVKGPKIMFVYHLNVCISFIRKVRAKYLQSSLFLHIIDNTLFIDQRVE